MNYQVSFNWLINAVALGKWMTRGEICSETKRLSSDRQPKSNFLAYPECIQIDSKRSGQQKSKTQWEWLLLTGSKPHLEDGLKCDSDQISADVSQCPDAHIWIESVDVKSRVTEVHQWHWAENMLLHVELYGKHREQQSVDRSPWNKWSDLRLDSLIV